MGGSTELEPWILAVPPSRSDARLCNPTCQGIAVPYGAVRLAPEAGMRSVAAVHELIHERSVFTDVENGVRPKSRWITLALDSN